MAACCGAERATAFCPDCGKRLAAGPKAELVDHMRSTIQRLTTLATGHEERAEPACQQMAKSERRRIEAWQSWLDWVLRQGE
jgi:hypothetical protein